MGESRRVVEQMLGAIHTTEVTRRGFIMTTLAVGFALAVRPVSAETIVTDAEGLTVGEVKIPTSDGSLPAYRAMPSQGRPFPVVVVVQEIFGVHEHIKDVCRRFAKLGYLAVAPELYARQGDVSKLSDINEIREKVVSKVPDAQGIPLDTVEQMRTALQAAGSPSEIVVYPNTPHGFHADYRASYRKEQAEDGWRRLQAWFKQHGVA